jgi:membrane fusion protein (multidrug efflux system)
MNAETLTADDDLPVIDAPRPARRRLSLKPLFIGVFTIAAVAGAVHFGKLAYFTEETDNSYLTGHVHRVSANVSGPLLEIIVDDNQLVKKGDVLARIDPREFDIMEKRAASLLEQIQAGRLQATAKAAEARAADSQAQSMITAAEAEIKGAEARLSLAKITLKRNESLLAGANQAVSQNVVDQSRGETESAEAQLGAARAKLDAAKSSRESAAATIQAADADIASANAGIDVQRAAIEEARRQKSYTEIIAPADGRIGAKNAEAGNRVQTGQALYALVEEDYWIVANFKETQLRKMAIGQPVEITVDSLGGKYFEGTVESFAPATGAQFALLPADNATGNFTKIVQRVPVKITFKPESIHGYEDRLRAGLSAIVRVKVR